MGENIKWNQSNLTEIISNLNTKKEKLSDELQQLTTLKGNISSVWRGDEHTKAEARIVETERALAKAIEGITSQITYLQQKNEAFESIKSRL